MCGGLRAYRETAQVRPHAMLSLLIVTLHTETKTHTDPYSGQLYSNLLVLTNGKSWKTYDLKLSYSVLL